MICPKGLVEEGVTPSEFYEHGDERCELTLDDPPRHDRYTMRIKCDKCEAIGHATLTTENDEYVSAKKLTVYLAYASELPHQAPEA
jgi:hypothetical protein